MTPRHCPNCGCDVFRPRRRRYEMDREIAYRSRFVRCRLDHKPQPAELMDLTSFMHGDPDPLVSCDVCGLVVRDESPEASYATDYYDCDLLEHLYPRYLEAFRKKRVNYQEFLQPGAEVVEIGSHLGAFLQAAEEQNARPTGLDVGEITSSFIARRGLRVKRAALEDSRLRRDSLDAIFVWNCFEQLEDPALTLRFAHTLLKRHGTLVLRTPNYGFYERCRTVGSSHWGLRVLAYNNLLGFPYLFGYTPLGLCSLVSRHGFEPVAGFDSTLITMPFPNLSSKLQREAAAVEEKVSRAAPKNPLTLSGPWIEIIFHRRSG